MFNLWNNPSSDDKPTEELFVDALRKGETTKLKSLMEQALKSSFNSRDLKNMQLEYTRGYVTALMFAIQETPIKKLLDVVTVLIEAAAEANPIDPRSKKLLMPQPLFTAVEKGYVEVASLLIDHGANVNVTNPNNGVTPLHIAVETSRADLVALLLESNANPNAARSDGVTPLHIAVEKNHGKIIEQLLDAHTHTNLNAVRRKDRATPLFIAAEKGYDSIVKQLLDAGADMNIPRLDGETPLSIAEKKKNRKVVNLLKDTKKKMEETTTRQVLTQSNPRDASSSSYYAGPTDSVQFNGSSSSVATSPALPPSPPPHTPGFFYEQQPLSDLIVPTAPSIPVFPDDPNPFPPRDFNELSQTQEALHNVDETDVTPLMLETENALLQLKNIVGDESSTLKEYKEKFKRLNKDKRIITALKGLLPDQALAPNEKMLNSIKELEALAREFFSDCRELHDEVQKLLNDKEASSAEVQATTSLRADCI